MLFLSLAQMSKRTAALIIEKPAVAKLHKYWQKIKIQKMYENYHYIDKSSDLLIGIQAK